MILLAEKSTRRGWEQRAAEAFAEKGGTETLTQIIFVHCSS